MFVFFLVLAILSLILLVIGTIWLLAGRGQTTRRSGRDVGAELMGSIGSEDGEGVPVAEKSVFVGKGVQVSRSVEIPYAEIKQLISDRQWRAALPVLLAMAGLFGLIVFGVLALWFRMDDKLVATLITGVVLFTMARIGWNISRA
jgi:hypothetical protein